MQNPNPPQAVAAMEFGAAVSGTPNGQLVDVLRALRKSGGFAKRCITSHSSRYNRARRALVVESHEAAVAMLCLPDPDEMTVKLKPYERERGILSAGTALQVWALFRVCGVVAVRGALETFDTERARLATESQFETKRKSIEKFRKSNDLSELIEAGLGIRDSDEDKLRYELKLPVYERPFVDSNIADSELVINLVKMFLMSSTVTLDTYSAVVSLPGATNMYWHPDVEDPLAFGMNVVKGKSTPLRMC